MNSKTIKVGCRPVRESIPEVINAQEPLTDLLLVRTWMSPKSSWHMKKRSNKQLNGFPRRLSFKFIICLNIMSMSLYDIHVLHSVAQYLKICRLQ